VVGFEVMGFLSTFLYRHPEASPLAECAEVSGDRIRNILVGIALTARDHAAFSAIAAGARSRGEVEFA
jgi:hypothetical protein